VVGSCKRMYCVLQSVCSSKVGASRVGSVMCVVQTQWAGVWWCVGLCGRSIELPCTLLVLCDQADLDL